MDLFNNMIMGLGIAIQPEPLLFCLLGVTLGTFVGVLPGMGTLTAIAILLPLTFYVPQASALIMLAGIYYGSQYGGSTTSILLNIPGTPSSAVACIDGYPLARQGKAGLALFITTMASFVGAIVGVVVVASFAPPLAEIALMFGAAEYAALMLVGLTAASTIGSGSPIKSIAMVAVGLTLGIVGTDVNSGAYRFVWGQPNLMDGLNIAAVSMGLFGVAEVARVVGRRHLGTVTQKVKLRSLVPTMSDIKESAVPAGRGSLIGAVLGILPGTGATIASFVSYAVEKRISKTPDRFGKGALAGLASSEASNNTASMTAFVPTLTLGIPGDAVMALILAGFLIHGIVPGPQLMVNHPDMFWGLIGSFWIGNVVLVILNLPMIGVWVRLLTIPPSVLYPGVLVIMAVGVYCINFNVFDIYVMLAFGGLGIVLNKYGFSGAALLLGFVLSPLLEENFRRALLLSRGDLMVFITRPISALFVSIAVFILIFTVVSSFRRKNNYQTERSRYV